MKIFVPTRAKYHHKTHKSFALSLPAKVCESRSLKYTAEKNRVHADLINVFSGCPRLEIGATLK